MNIEGFRRKDLEAASARYLEVERQIESTRGAEAVLVSVDSLEGVRHCREEWFHDLRGVLA
jgi:hypothetical protein